MSWPSLRPAIATRYAIVVACVVAGGFSDLLAQSTGQLAGRLLAADGRGIGGVSVQIVEIHKAEVTDTDGRFVIADVAPGKYTVLFTAGDRSVAEPGVVVQAGLPTVLEKTVDWELAFAETITVNGVSRRPERIVDAPAAATSLPQIEIAREAAHGQLPRALAFSPGVELTQASLHDFNLNVRGFNSVFNRRILTLVDGRDPSIPGLAGAQEWGSMVSPLDDVESIEFVRGPGAALYGAGAFNGILLVTSKAPRDSLGGKARISVGELATQRYEIRHAGDLGNGWFYKGVGGFQRSEDFTVSRVGSVEYAAGVLPPEAIAPPLDHYQSVSGSIRLDKYFTQARAMTVEGGLSHFEGTTNVSDLGRVQQTDVARPWFRFNLNAPRWNVLASSSWRSAPDQSVLSSGGLIFLDSSNTAVEAQGNSRFAAGRGRIVGGVSFGTQFADSSNPEGRHTIYAEKKDEQRGAIYGQVDYDLTAQLKGVFSLRWDDSTLHDPELSPRAAVVFTAAPGQTLRVSYNHAFKSPTLSELFVHVPIAPPIDLSALERALSPVLGGVALGFQSIPLLGVGNESLTVEKINSLEFGYNGVWGSRLYVTASYYRNNLKNFTTTLLPQLGTSFGRLNPHFGPYAPPPQLSAGAATAVTAALQAAIPTLYPIMSNDTDGSPIFVAISNRNYGKVDTQGVELGLYFAVAPGWMWTLNYNHFAFDVKEDVPDSPLVPNAPANQFSTGVSYSGAPLDAAVRFRWVDDFPWATGIFIGHVESYGIVDVNLGRQLNARWGVGLDIANVLDNDHYEVFGGDLLGRRALVNLTYAW